MLDTIDLTEQTHRLREGAGGCEGGEGTVREFRMDVYPLLCVLIKPTRTYCIAQGTLLSVMWQPGWEGSFEEKGYMYMHG